MNSVSMPNDVTAPLAASGWLHDGTHDLFVSLVVGLSLSGLDLVRADGEVSAREFGGLRAHDARAHQHVGVLGAGEIGVPTTPFGGGQLLVGREDSGQRLFQVRYRPAAVPRGVSLAIRRVDGGRDETVLSDHPVSQQPRLSLSFF
jgi:hypothetical protein